MLTSPKKTGLTEVQTTHVDLFVEYYDRLKRWALQFTKHDHDLAEDLLHDAFIHFTLTKPKLESVQSLENYLYIVMRNLHLSQLRRGNRNPLRAVSVVEYDTIDMSFWANDPRDKMRMRDVLGEVCQYACIRKETSKAGSVLILRFFHGYYPEEIARVMRSNRASVSNRLLRARAEARQYLEDPNRLAFLSDKHSRSVERKVDQLGDELRLELRRQIFGSRQGECRSVDELQALYGPQNGECPDQRALGHIVSCETCLDIVNSMLGLPPLASRYPLDTIGKDLGPNDKTGGGSGGTGGGAGGGPNMLDSYFARREAYYYHEPQELCISVNGQLQSFQKVVAGKGELTLIIDSAEMLGFVEVFSELGLRLLLLNIEPPPTGDGEQSARVTLSSGRTLDASLDFSGPFPALHVTYTDPELAMATAIEATDAPILSESGAAGVPARASRSGVEDADGNSTAPLLTKEGWPSLRGRGGSLFAAAQESRGTFNWRTWFEPMRIAVVATLLLVGVVGYWFVNQPTSVEPTARAVLKQARDAEFALAPTVDKVLHRNYQVEVWSNGELNSRRRIDEWQKQKASARRTYDEQGRMIAGKWIGEDGRQQVFETGQKLKTLYKGETDPTSQLAMAEPTANAFANLTDRHGVTPLVTLEETPTAYTFNFEDRNGETAQTGPNERLIAATLTLDRNTYMPTSQTLVLQIGGEQREYRFSDVRVEQKPLSEVNPLIFVPEAELSKGATVVTKPILSEPGALATGSGPTTVITRETATLDTEVEVFRALDSVNALSGDQITIERTASGQVKVTGIVDTGQRKTEILNALSSLRNAPGLNINVQTAAEAASARKQTSGTITPIDVDTTASTSTNLPVEDELKAHFERRGISGEKLNEQITNYANAVLNRSDSLRRNALSLKRLAERFSLAELDRLEPSKKEQWRALLQSKAAAVAADARSLSSQLSAVGLGARGESGSSPPFKGGVDGVSPDGVVVAAQRLFGLGVECDAQVRQSFSISRGGSGSASVKTVQFWRNLNQIARLAEDIQRF